MWTTNWWMPLKSLKWKSGKKNVVLILDEMHTAVKISIWQTYRCIGWVCKSWQHKPTPTTVCTVTARWQHHWTTSKIHTGTDDPRTIYILTISVSSCYISRTPHLWPVLGGCSQLERYTCKVTAVLLLWYVNFKMVYLRTGREQVWMLTIHAQPPKSTHSFPQLN